MFGKFTLCKRWNMGWGLLSYVPACTKSKQSSDCFHLKLNTGEVKQANLWFFAQQMPGCMLLNIVIEKHIFLIDVVLYIIMLYWINHPNKCLIAEPHWNLVYDKHPGMCIQVNPSTFLCLSQSMWNWLHIPPLLHTTTTVYVPIYTWKWV